MYSYSDRICSHAGPQSRCYIVASRPISLHSSPLACAICAAFESYFYECIRLMRLMWLDVPRNPNLTHQFEVHNIRARFKEPLYFRHEVQIIIDGCEGICSAPFNKCPEWPQWPQHTTIIAMLPDAKRKAWDAMGSWSTMTYWQFFPPHLSAQRKCQAKSSLWWIGWDRLI